MHHHAPQWIDQRNHFYGPLLGSDNSRDPNIIRKKPSNPQKKNLFSRVENKPCYFESKTREGWTRQNPHFFSFFVFQVCVFLVLQLEVGPLGFIHRGEPQPDRGVLAVLHETLEFCSINHMFVTLPSVFHVTNQLLTLEPPHFYTPLNHWPKKNMVQLQERFIVYDSRRMQQWSSPVARGGCFYPAPKHTNAFWTQLPSLLDDSEI